MRGFFLFTFVVIIMAVLSYREPILRFLQQREARQDAAMMEENPSGSKAAAKTEEPVQYSYSMQVQGAEIINVLPGDVHGISILTDDETASVDGIAFVKAIAERTFSNDAIFVKEVFASIPPLSYTERNPLKPTVYVYFNKKNGFPQRMVSSLNLTKLSASARHESDPVFEITATQWMQQGNDVKLVFFVRPVALPSDAP